MTESNIIAVIILSYMLNLITTIIAVVKVTMAIEHRLTKLESILEVISRKFDVKYIDKKGV